MLERVGTILPLTWYLTSDRVESSLGWQARQFVQLRFWVSKYDLQHHEAFPMDSQGGLRHVSGMALLIILVAARIANVLPG